MSRQRRYPGIVAGVAVLLLACTDQELMGPDELPGRPQFAFPTSYLESRVTTSTTREEEPDVDGNLIVFEDDRDGNREIYLYDATTGLERRITNNAFTQERPAISGNRIVWADNRHGNWDIYLYNLSTNTEQRITTNSADQRWPDIDGQRIVWQDWRSGVGQAYMRDLNHSSEQLVGTGDHESEIYISGDWVAFTWHGGPCCDADAVARNVVTGERRDIELEVFNQYVGGISYPWVVYDDGTGNNWNITAYNLVTRAYVRVVHPGTQNESAIGGNILAWRDDRFGTYRIVSYDLSDNTERTLSTVTGFQFRVAVASNGQRIVWHDNRNRPGTVFYDIYHFGPPLPPPNRAPTASVQIDGVAIRNEGDEMTFTSIGTSDPDGNPLTYAWNFGDGSPVVSGPASTHATVTHLFEDNNLYTVTLTVTDPGGLSDDATVNAELRSVPPTATFNAPLTATPGSTFQISLSDATDASPQDVRQGFRYSFSCGGVFPPSLPTATHNCTAPAEGSVTVRGRVIDKDGAFTDYAQLVTVNNTLPTATFNTPAAVDEGSAATLTLTNPQDSPGQMATLRYAFDCGAGYGLASSTASRSCPTSDDGTLNVRGKIIDILGGFTEYTASITVRNVAPAATFQAPTTVESGAAFSIALTNPVDPSPVDASGLRNAFDCGNGTYSVATAVAEATCTASGDGSLTVRGRILDKDGGSSEYSASVTIANLTPTATFNAPAAVNEGSPAAISLTNAHDSPAHQAALVYAFDCGSGFGAPSASPTASCPTSDDGTLNVRGKVIDPVGASSEYQATVRINNVAPSVQAGNDASLTTGGSLALSGRFSDPGADANWRWTINWGDGTSSSGDAVSAAAPIVSSHTYAGIGSFTVRLTVTDKDGASGFDELQVNVAPLGILIDVVPPNIKLNENGNGKLPVKVLQSPGFDFSDIDLESVRLGDGLGNETPIARQNNGSLMASHEDKDGKKHMMLHFERSALIAAGDLNPNTTRLILTARLRDGRVVSGWDTVQVIR